VDEGILAITSPSADVTLAFTQAGRVAEIYCKPGDSIKAGQLIAQLDDAVEQAQLERLKAESENMTQIQAGEASLAQKKVDLSKLEGAAARDAATELEVEHAKLDVRIAELSLQAARFQHEQAQRAYAEAKIGIERMKLRSPIDGRVEAVPVERGEAVNALADVVRIVQIDPLWIDVPVPLAKARLLTAEDKATVSFLNSNEPSVEGKAIYIAAVADAASGTLLVRVEAPNQSNRPAGEHVRVAFPPIQ
jgi:RND family efflux transporter MFP subunit